MPDPRITRYCRAVEALKEGRRAEIPIEGDDDMARLGASLAELSRAIEKRSEEARLLQSVTEKINAGLTLDDVMDHVFESFQPILPYDRIGLALLEENGRYVCARWSRTRGHGPPMPYDYRAPLAGSSLQDILETGRPRLLSDLPAYLREHPGSESTRRIVAEGMRSSLTCPLTAAGKHIGFVFFSSAETGAYQDAHADLLSRVAGQLSAVVEKSRLYQELYHLSEERRKLLGIAAHDLRSPLTVMKGYATLLLDGSLGPLTDAQREAAQVLSDSGEGMIDLVDHVLDISAIQAGQLQLDVEPVDVKRFLSECRRTHRPLAAAKSISLDLDVASGLPKVLIDPHRMRQALGNLIANAIKYSNPRTRAVLRARPADDAVEISVEDEGVGIPEAEIGKLFAEFSRSSARPTGGEASSGLGLSIAKRVIDEHGGRVWVESKVACGSTFTFTLPVAPDGAPASRDEDWKPAQKRS